MYKRRSFSVIFAGLMVLSLVIVLALVYAGFTGQLEINGNAVNRQSKWDIHFENLSNITTTHTAKALTQPRLASSTSIEDYSVSTTSPGDTISFTFDVVNDGNYNASIMSVNIGTPTCTGIDSVSNSNVCAYLHYTLTYDSGATVQTGDVLYAKETNTMKVTLIYDDSVTSSELATEDVSISNLGITINFQQSSDALVKDNGEVTDYKVYKQGDKITLNNEDYWVIENSGADKEYLVAVKDEPLTVAEVNLYEGVGTENNHVNKYTSSSVGTAINKSGYGGMAYYSSETCGYTTGSLAETGCTTEYNQSDIKYVVDTWATTKFDNDELKEVNGYRARLIARDEYNVISSYNWRDAAYWYWTMTPHDVSGFTMYYVNGGNSAVFNYVHGKVTSNILIIRPVINVYKSAIDSNNNIEQ